jgi:GH15 family glucan-1,4-alpha-glucosidase
MSRLLEDYALIGDCQTAALVARDGSIDWLCVPRFDSCACFAALLGTPEHGCWRIAPAGEVLATRRRYRSDSLVLETEFTTREGRVALVDFMPPRSRAVDVVRIVEGREGRVPLRMELRLRLDYGSIVPWVRRIEDGIVAIAGPDALRLRTRVPLQGRDFATYADFAVDAGERVGFDLTYQASYEPAPAAIDVERALDATEAWWCRWTARARVEGPWRDAVARSLVTLKALTYEPTGGIVAAPTTSLPERLGGVRNWDYRYCWLRDATFTLLALVEAGYIDEARAWREWLLRAAAGRPSQLHIMYGIDGQRRLPELELPWLPGYEASRPVRVGNAAHGQFQLDVYGEILDALHQCWFQHIAPAPEAWRVAHALVEHVAAVWERPDEGIWEVRGGPRHFTHSKMMAWVALDRAVRGVERFGLTGPIERWRELRARIHDDVCRRGYDAERGAFVQAYGSKTLDASLLMMPLVGFLPASDPRVRSTVDAIERELTTDGLVARYRTHPDIDGLPAGEGMFLLCTFWLADCLQLLGRQGDARRVFERALALRNDVGLLSEAYDVASGRLVGNFPQAFSHVGLINTARNLGGGAGPSDERAASDPGWGSAR